MSLPYGPPATLRFDAGVDANHDGSDPIACEEATMAKTKFGVFSLSQFPDLSKVVESFDDDLGFFELAEQLGYDKVWIAEHLFSTYGLVTSTQVYAAAIAQRTKK